MGKLGFDKCHKLFAQVGVAPRDSEKATATWLGDVISCELVEHLRSTDDPTTSLPTALGHIEQFSSACATAYAGNIAMDDFVRLLESLQVIFQVASTTDRLAHPPSAIRAAVGRISTAQSGAATQFHLALHYGDLAKHSMKLAREALAGSAQDSVADGMVSKIIKDIAALDNGSVEYKSDLIDTSLRSLDHAVSLSGKTQLENLKAPFVDLFGSLARVCSSKADSIVEHLSKNIMPAVRAVSSHKLLADGAEKSTNDNMESASAPTDAKATSVGNLYGGGGAEGPLHFRVVSKNPLFRCHSMYCSRLWD